MRFPPLHPRFWPALGTGVFVGLGMSAFVAVSTLDTAFRDAPGIIGVLAGIGSFLLVFFLH
jgi:hypothetical protein